MPWTNLRRTGTSIVQAALEATALSGYRTLCRRLEDVRGTLRHSERHRLFGWVVFDPGLAGPMAAGAIEPRG